MKKFGLFICFAIMMANTVSAQTIKKYEGEMRYPKDLELLKQFFGTNIDNERLYGSYYYYENQDGERVKHGTFQFYFNEKNRVILRGKYLNGKKTGEWIIKDSIVTKEYIKKIALNDLRITYKDDNITGPCQYAKYAKTTFTNIKCNFNNRVIVGDVVVQSYKDTTRIREYKGFVSDDGLLHGIWTIRDKGGLEMLQKRLYYKGGLVSIEESDFSTGDKYMCFCAFDGMKTTPNIKDIKDTIVNGLDCIMWNGQFAVKDKDYGNYNSKMSDERLSSIVFYAFQYSLYSTMQKQKDSWDYKYSVKGFSEKVAKIRKDRELLIQDSIDNRERMVRRANMDIDAELQRYMDSTPKKTIKKSSMEGSDVVFKTKSEVFRGEFNKEYMLNSMGEVYQVENIYQKYNVLANKTGDIVLIKFIKRDLKTDRSVNVVYLVDKRASEVEVYEVMPSALNGLPLKW